MQTTQDGGGQNSGGDSGVPKNGILEDSDIVRIFRHGRLVCRCFGTSSQTLVGHYAVGEEHVEVEWTRWSIRGLYWAYAPAMLFLQGASLQSLIEPFLILDGELRSVSDPSPGMRNVVLAEVRKAPPHITYPQMFHILASRHGTLDVGKQ